MEETPSEGTTGRRTVSYTRTIVISLTVGLVYGSHFLINFSYITTLHGMVDYFSEWSEKRKLLQITYVITGIVAYGLFAVLFQKLRRKTCLYLVCTSQLATCVVLLFANSFWLLHISRAFAAVSSVGAGMMCVIYVSEISPDDIRGGLVATHKLLYGLTEVVPIAAYASGWSVKSLPFAYTSMFLSTAVAICTYIGVPESPIYFLRLDDTARAKQALMSLRGDEAYVSQEITNRKHVLKVTRSDNVTSTSIYQDCTNQRTVMFMCVMVLLYLTRIFGGFSIVRYEVEAIYWILPTSYNRYNELYYMLVDISLIILSNLFVVVLCDHVGRRILIFVSASVCSVSLMTSGIVYHVLEHNEHLMDTCHIINIIISFFYLFSYYLGISSLPEVVISDVFPPKILNTQIAILGSLHICVEFLVHYVKYNAFRNIVLHWLFAGLTFVAGIFIFKFLPETKRRPPGFLLVDNEESVLFSSLQEEEEEEE